MIYALFSLLCPSKLDQITLSFHLIIRSDYPNFASLSTKMAIYEVSIRNLSRDWKSLRILLPFQLLFYCWSECLHTILSVVEWIPLDLPILSFFSLSSSPIFSPPTIILVRGWRGITIEGERERGRRRKGPGYLDGVNLYDTHTLFTCTIVRWKLPNTVLWIHRNQIKSLTLLCTIDYGYYP